ncbi:hypothetical protein BS17DRAFT_782251 [Gyrodon lividus]|nr:hypothetical protein BS17DRAFT_782251 [Gyrodon lividus]
MGDGLPRLLTGDEFYNWVVEHEKTTAQEELVQKERHKHKEGRVEAMAAWKMVDCSMA